MNTLVVHPDDRSTDFLKLIYKDKYYNFLTDCDMPIDTLRSIISYYDKIILMGHGTPHGLINPKRGGFLIDDSFVDILKEKETISIWCWSDEFFKRYKMKGFHTGLIISEICEEQAVFGNIPLNKEDLLENMEFMANCFNKCIDKSPKEIQSYMLEHYNRTDPVSVFNRSKMFVLD